MTNCTIFSVTVPTPEGNDIDVSDFKKWFVGSLDWGKKFEFGI
jgi:hypothetical protein